MDSEIADVIANECINHYQDLGKKGKPIFGQEWTLLSSVVMTLNGKNTVVAMATGTKCLGHNELSPRGDLVNDSHAEVLTRRCFLRYLYDQILKFQSTGTSDIIIGCNETNQYEMNPDVKFHFYSSHVPCGDASIIPKHGVKRKCENVDNIMIKRKKEVVTDVKEEVHDGVAIISGEASTRQIKTYMKERNSEKNLLNDTKGCIRLLSDIRGNTNNFTLTTSDHELSKHSNKEFPMERVEDPDSMRSDILEQALSKFTKEDFMNTNWSVSNDAEDSMPQDVNRTCEEAFNTMEEELVDVHRTGAKCLKGEDRKLPGVLYHEVGAVRTKPGRGVPTLSVSCSDKMARWIACGLQGALLSLLLSRPVMLTSVVVGGGGPYSADVLRRALLSRSGSPHSVALLHSSIVFPHSRYSATPSVRPCPSAILWARVSHKPVEVCVEGRRQGAARNCRDNGRLLICKLEFLRSFLSVSNRNEYQGMSYKALKTLAEKYNEAWAQAKSALKVWTSKPPHLEDFKIDSQSE